MLAEAVGSALASQISSGKPLAIIVAGHNGSGKSTMWHEHLSAQLQMPLINADRMMMSILPEVPAGGVLPAWASALRDTNLNWMGVTQKGVESFVLHAMTALVPFAMETVFSHWVEGPDGRVESKITLIRQLQAAGYFVLLLFVGLADVQLSIGRVATRVARGGHAVDPQRLAKRFPRTQKAVAAAVLVADAAVLMDNSREQSKAFTVCRIALKGQELFDLRAGSSPVPPVIAAWLDKASPRHAA